MQQVPDHPGHALSKLGLSARALISGPLLWWVQFPLKPATKTLGPHGVFIRRKGRKYLIADGAFKHMQVDGPGACRLDADEHHLGLALRTGGAPNAANGMTDDDRC
jgi:hypothetical protein